MIVNGFGRTRLLRPQLAAKSQKRYRAAEKDFKTYLSG